MLKAKVILFPFQSPPLLESVLCMTSCLTLHCSVHTRDMRKPWNLPYLLTPHTANATLKHL